LGYVRGSASLYIAHIYGAIDGYIKMIEVITIKFDRDKELFQSEEFKKFILNKKINGYKAEFFQIGANSYWSIFIDYDTLIDEKMPAGKNKLAEPENLLFTRLKEWRKLKAEEHGFPVYLVATNNQLLKMIENKTVTLEGLKNIQGFGQKRIENYGKDITGIVKDFYEIKK